MGEALLVGKNLGVEFNPFDAIDGGGRLGRPLQKALGEVIRHVGLETPVVIVCGSAGTGKSLLAKIAKRACADMGMSTRHVQHGAFADIAGGQRCDVLLVDDVDILPDLVVHKLLLEGEKRPATTAVLLCLPEFVDRFVARGNAVVVELTRLSPTDTRHYLQQRITQAGFPDLFTPVAFDSLVDGSRGVPRWLWSIAGLAYFYAASAGASQIGREHVAHAVASVVRPEMPGTAAPTASPVRPTPEAPVTNVAALPVANPQRVSERAASVKRGQDAPPPAPRLPRAESQPAPVRSRSAQAKPALGAVLAGLDPIPAETLDGLKRIHASAEEGGTQQWRAFAGPALGVAAALAATAALTIFFQPSSRNEKAPATAVTRAVAAPVVAHAPSAPPAQLPSAAVKAPAVNKTVATNPPVLVTDKSPVVSKPVTTRPVRIIETETAPVLAPPAETTVAVLPPQRNTIGNGPVQAVDAAQEADDTANAAAALAAQQQAERNRVAQEETARVQAVAMREANAKEAANRGKAMAKAAADALAAQKAKQQEKRKSDFKPSYRMY